MDSDFLTPPESAKPWVYWYFMDGNSSRPGMTADLESMKKVGIGGGIFLEVNVGIQRGNVPFMSAEWQGNFVHAVHEADRLGLQIAVGAGPGWCGTGGPWVKPEQSMQHLVATAKDVVGPKAFEGNLDQPKPREPFFGMDSMSGRMKERWAAFYDDIAVIAFPTPKVASPLADVGELALYHRAPFTSGTVAPFLPAPATIPNAVPGSEIPVNGIVDITDKLRRDGTLDCQIPAGNWTIMRLGRTSTGQGTRPAPDAGLGFETDKFDPTSLDAHFSVFPGSLIDQLGSIHPGRGLTGLHFDSWEMSAQNWTKNFRQLFTRMRGYDPLPYLPAMTGRIVGSPEVTSRFLWDLRQTTQELIYENHIVHLRELGKRRGLNFSSEPYDMNPAADLYVGSVADIPMCEFWSKGFGYNSEYSCFEATSIAHVMGRPIVGAESFTAEDREAWQQYPGSMKAQTDWALATGINRIVFHRYQHQPEPVQPPGITMGPYGVHWERTQTWWDMVPAYHAYISRASYLLQQGNTVADILYLTPEGAPHVFRPPPTATIGKWLDRRGYNFDGVDPHVLIERASVKDGRIVFDGGASYAVLVLPRVDTMTPKLLTKVKDLIENGATIVGAPPRKSPSLADFPAGDQELAKLVSLIWGDVPSTDDRKIGRGLLVPDQVPAVSSETTAANAARWIWFNEGNPAAGAPAARRYFSRTVHLDDVAPISKATFWMTADNSFELRVNGKVVGTGDDFRQRLMFEVAPFLKSGDNLITVTAINAGDAANPAGLIGALHVEFKGAPSLDVVTDAKWLASTSAEGNTSPTLELGPAGMSPWNLNTNSYDLYPDYASTAALLKRLNVPQDFESDAPIRYTHRRDGGTDIYFIANTEDKPVTTKCRFNVMNELPEWWDPRTGTIRDLPEFEMKNGMTEIPVRLDAFESGFVICRRPVPQNLAGKNFESVKPIQSITTPWSVTFDAKLGGPAAPVVFEKLDDWIHRPEPQIKFYSGKANYSTTFDVADVPAGKTFISLGTVMNMASVKLNDKDLGIAWCAPWRVEIPQGLLKPTGNRLEVTVANLWINRLIGDSGKPQAERVSFSTFNPYDVSSPLRSSGLLGPVELVVPDR